MHRHLKLRVCILLGLLSAASICDAAFVRTAPSLAATELDGTTFDLATEQGHVVIVNFWATWCAPCRIEMPALDAYYRKRRDEGLTLLAVSIDAGASVKKLSAATAAYSFHVARIDDVRMARSQMPAAVPTTRVYDREGILRFDSGNVKGHPPMDEATLDRVVAPLLAAGATPR